MIGSLNSKVYRALKFKPFCGIKSPVTPISRPAFSLSKNFGPIFCTQSQKRFYVQDVDRELLDNIEFFIRSDSSKNDLERLDALLDENGWDISFGKDQITLSRQVDDFDIKVDVSPNSVELDNQKRIMNAQMKLFNPSLQEEATDFFRIHITRNTSKSLGVPELIFNCTCKNNSMIIENIIACATGQTFETGQCLNFNELTEELQTSFENFLGSLGFTSEMPEIISLSLLKYDLNQDKEWGTRIIKFLSV